ncbi:hypothetical protein H0H87_003893 [Tephrocybe sp. NHM501043]|nr:hypothetical protein H0H87_003893 [Tephrocybe sp. NHM501043]
MQPLTSTPSQPKRVFPSSLPTVRRSTSSAIPNAPNTSPLPPIPAKPLPSPSTSTGVPAFRSLRSFLPFGHSKPSTSVSSLAPPSPNVSKSPFISFGSVRRSMNRERKASLDLALPPVISIDQATRDELEDSAVRRSVSLSKLHPTDIVQEGSSDPFQDDDDTIVFTTLGRPMLRTPSPGPPISADLSIILEADTSGISKHIPSTDEPSQASSPMSPDSPTPDMDINTSELDLSTTHLQSQVLEAMRSENSNAPQQWMLADKAVIIDDGEEEIDQSSFNLNALDKDLADILRSPYRPLPQSTGANDGKRASGYLQETPLSHPGIALTHGSPDLTQYVIAPSPTIINRASPLLEPIRSRLPRQQSSLPRLRPPLPPSPHSPQSPSPSTIVPNSSSSDTTRRGDVTVNSSAFSSAPSSPATAFSHPSPIPPPLSSSTSFLSRRFASNKAQTPGTSLPASQSVSNSTISKLRAPFTHTPRPGLQRTASTSAADPKAVGPTLPTSLSTSRLVPRPSLDSTARTSGSFDRPRSSFSPSEGHHSEYEAFARPSIDALREATTDSGDGRTTSAALARARKRSLSVQDRLAGRLGSSMRRRGTVGEADRDVDGGSASEFGEQRPSSSLSGRMGRRWGTSGRAESESGAPPMTEWLGPRTVKAFRAAGLLDFDRDQQDRTNTGLSASVGPTQTRYTPMRSTSEYNPRAASRLAMSEAGGSSVSRRGSGSAVGSYGLMESPTFTTSSRDTPRSISTAPTSVSGSSSAFLGRDRDREREREREEIRDLKDKHASETGALLGALSDSQRTTKVLREENGELRERLEQSQAEVEALRRVVSELTKETGDLRIQVQMLKLNSNPSTNGKLAAPSWGVPIRKSALSSPLRSEQNDDDDDEWSSPAVRKDRRNFDVRPDSHNPLNRTGKRQDEGHYRADHLDLPQTGPMFSSTPANNKHKRRFSTTSSIFPVPPANMTMLLHDNDHDLLNGSPDHVRFSPPASQATSLGDDSVPDTSVVSAVSVSPTNFSMTTGSPGSLFLRPEHEVHLGDMDSLDLGIRGTPDTGDNEWSD